MKLALKNIREYRAREYRFPERGLVLLKGESGAGKSTLLDVISFALFDNRRGLKTFNTSTCGVELEGFGLQLKRTKNPNQLLVNDDEGAVAQAEIERRLGMNETEFMASCYIVQDLYGSLLTLSPADQLKLVQKLACGDDDPELVKERIRGLVRSHEMAIAEAEGQVAALETMRQEKIAALSHFASLAMPAEVVTAQEIAAMERELEGVQEQIASVRTRILANAEAWRDPYFALADRLATIQGELVATEHAAVEKLSIVEQRLAELGEPWLKISQDGLASRREALAVQIAAEEKAAAGRATVERLRARYGGQAEKTSVGELAASMARLLERCREEGEDERRELAAVCRQLDDLALARHAQACPECQTPLVVIDGRLKKSGVIEAEVHVRHQHLETTRAKAEAKLSELRGKTDALQSDLGTLRGLLEHLGEEALDSSDHAARESREELQDLVRYADEQRRIERQRAELMNERRGIEHGLEAKRRELAEIEGRLVAAGASRRAGQSRAELEAERRELDAALLRWENQASGISTRLAEARSAQSRYVELLRQYARRRELETALHDLDERIADRKATARLSQDRYEAALRLRDLSDRAATDAVSSILNTINIHAQRYLEALFEDTGTSVYLLNEKKLGSGETRAKLDVEIFHKGARYTSLRDLSGGERSRITLAFQLALCEIYRSPIFMLDEGMKGLDPEAKLRCLELLKEAAEERLVLVVEHGAPESAFDEVIHVAARG